MACSVCGDEGHNKRTHAGHPEPQVGDLLGQLQASVDAARAGRASPEVAAAVARLDEEMVVPHGPGCTLADPCSECQRAAVADPHCPHCGLAMNTTIGSGEYRCSGCGAVRQGNGTWLFNASSVVAKRDTPQVMDEAEAAGLAAAIAQTRDEQCWCDTDGSMTESYAVDCPAHGHYGRREMWDDEGFLLWVEDDDGAPLPNSRQPWWAGHTGPLIVPWRTVLGPDEPIRITLPGVYELTAEQYHDPDVTGDWLSNSDARQLTDPGCPAQFRHDRDNRVKKRSEAFAVGHAYHARVLGKGEAIAVRPAEWDSWRTNVSRAWRDEQEAAGRSVITPEQAEVVEAMAVAVHQKPRAHELLSQPGRAEVALFWVDPETGVRRRCMVDFLPDQADHNGVMRPVDLKSADEVAPNDNMSRKLYDHAWHRQGTTIADGIIALGLARSVDFHFVVQSKSAPYLVTIVRLDSLSKMIGHIENREALMVFRECVVSGVWPDYGDEAITLSVPLWIAKQYDEEMVIR